MPTSYDIESSSKDKQPASKGGTIQSFLDETMLAAAHRGATLLQGVHHQFKVKFERGAPNEWLEAPRVVEQSWQSFPASARIWDYKKPEFNKGKVRIENLSCLVSGMNHMKMTVCSSIEWGPVEIEYNDFKGKVHLPLEQKYILSKDYLLEGATGGNDRFWKLPLYTDKSFEWVFGYEFSSTAYEMMKIPRDAESPEPIKRGTLAPFADDLADIYHVSLFAPGDKASNGLRPTPLRIVVVVTLVSCKESDFGLLNAGRLQPMIMVICNRELKSATGTVRLMRPSITQMTTMVEDGAKEWMTPTVSTILFTDNNAGSVYDLPSVVWDEQFAYYDVKPKPGDTYVLAYPQKDKPRRPVADAEVNVVKKVVDDGSVGVVSLPRKVLKTAGQGEFDNVHIAPKMFVPASAIDWPDFGVAGPPSMRRAYESVKEITMAPFCVHDCLHMHVRWGEWIGTNVFTSDPAFRGWVGDDLPNDDNGSGLPLVPANQKITLKLLPGEDSAPSRDQAPCGYEYTAEAQQKVRAATWQIMMHHGVAYSLSNNWRGESEKFVAPSSGPSLKGEGSSWAMMYWNLRWVFGDDGKLHERLRFTKNGLSKLRLG